MTTFQTIRTKDGHLFFYEGSLHDNPPVSEGVTWDYHTFLLPGTFFGKIASEGHPGRYVKTEKYSSAFKMLQMHLKVLQKAKVDLRKNNWHELVPESVLLDFLNAKNEMTEDVFKTVPVTENYGIMLKLMPVLFEIRKRKIFEDRVIDYKPFRSRTGRLVTGTGSFPILTMKKEKRGFIVPKNGCFLALDYNAMDVRVVIGLCGMKQPENDIHDFHCREIFHIEDRKESKRRFFAWLYNKDSVDEELEKRYDRRVLLANYYQNGVVKTPFGVNMVSDNRHALSYLVQSSSASVFYEQVSRIHELLKGRKSELACLLHDEVILDFSYEDAPLLKDLREAYRNTRYGEFLIGVKAGKNLGDMKKIK